MYALRGAKNLPVVLWIHGGGWQSGDKGMVAEAGGLLDTGFVFVSIDPACCRPSRSALSPATSQRRWGGHPRTSRRPAGTRPPAGDGPLVRRTARRLMCTDNRYAKAEGFSLAIVEGCVASGCRTSTSPRSSRWRKRRQGHHLPMPTYGHRRSSAITPRASRLLPRDARREEQGTAAVPRPSHRRHPDTGAPAQRLAAVLRDGRDFREGRHRARDLTAPHQRQHRRVDDPVTDRAVRVRGRGAQAVTSFPGCGTRRLHPSCSDAS